MNSDSKAYLLFSDEVHISLVPDDFSDFKSCTDIKMTSDDSVTEQVMSSLCVAICLCKLHENVFQVL